VSGLLDDPWRGRIRRAPGDVHAAAPQLDEEEDVESLQPDGLDREEVNGQQALAMCPDELAPRRLSALACRSETSGPEPGADRRRGDRDAKPFQFADNPWIAPARVLAREPQHQLSRLTSQRWPTDRPRVRPPLRDQAAMPADQGRRRDDEGSPSCAHGHSALSRASCRHVGSDAPPSFQGIERREETADDRVHADDGPLAAALRSPPSRSRPTHRGRDRCHGPRRPSLDGARLAGRGTDSCGLFGWSGPHGTGASTGGLEAAATRPEALRAAPARLGPPPNLRVSSHRRALTRWSRQGAHPARRGAGPRASPIAIGPAVPTSVAESVPCLAPTAKRVYA